MARAAGTSTVGCPGFRFSWWAFTESFVANDRWAEAMRALAGCALSVQGTRHALGVGYPYARCRCRLGTLEIRILFLPAFIVLATSNKCTCIFLQGTPEYVPWPVNAGAPFVDPGSKRKLGHVKRLNYGYCQQ